jgi:hypothetical protein
MDCVERRAILTTGFEGNITSTGESDEENGSNQSLDHHDECRFELTVCIRI